MKSKKPRISLYVTLGVLAAAGFGAYKYFNQPVKLTYLKAQVTRGPLESVISATGTLSATRSIPVGSRVSGNVVKMYADYNTPVKKGQLLAEIDPSTFQNTMEQRQASLESAKTQRLTAEVAERRADIDVANAQTAIKNQDAAVARAKSAEVEAKRQYDLQISLQKEGIAATDAVTRAKVAWDQAIFSTESAESQLVAAKATLEATKAQRQVVMTQSITADSAIKQAQGQLTDAELQLSFTKIPAPVDGVVIARNMNEGQTVQASTTAPQLYEIAEDLREMHVETNIDESDISRVQVGQEATFTVDAFPGQTFRGEVIQIRRAAVNVQNVISYTVVVSVQNPELKLFPGMTANTRIIVDRVQSTLRVPSSALRFRPPQELTVVGDVGGGKGKANKDSKDSKDSGDAKDGAEKSAEPKQTSKAEDSKETTVAENAKGRRNRADVDANADGDNAKGGRGNIDINQFRDKDGNIDQAKLREQFAKNGKNFDPSRFKGRADGSGNGKGFDPSQFGRGGGRGGRGGVGAGAAGQPQQQTVYRLNAKNEIEAVRIRTGISDGNWIQVLGNNLQEGEELITAVEGLPVTANKQNTNFPGGNNQFKGGNFKGF